MLGLKIFTFFLLFSSVLTSSEKKGCRNKSCESTLNSPCLKYSKSEVIAQLWKTAPKTLSSNVEKFRDAILCFAKRANCRQIAVLQAVTLRALAILTNADPKRRASCSNRDYITASNNVKVGNCGNYIQLLTNTFTFAGSLTDFGTQMSMVVAGCDVLPDTPAASSLPCPLDVPSLLTALCRSSKLISNEITESIKRLIKSSCDDENSIGQSAIAALTPAKAEYAYQISLAPEYLKMLQLRSCSRKVPEKCCPIREQTIQDNNNALSPIRDAIIDRIIADSVKQYKCGCGTPAE